jgi:hypothetical protein
MFQNHLIDLVEFQLQGLALHYYLIEGLHFHRKILRDRQHL